MRTKSLVTAAAVAVLLIAGCGNANDGAASKASTSPGALDCTTQGVSTDKVSIGASLPLSGPLAVTAAIDAGRSAYFKALNAAGGVGGRTIEYKSYDDQGDPARTAANARRLVEQDKVFALTGTVGTAQGLGVVDYLKTAKVPFLFPVSGSGVWSQPVKPLVFGFQPVYPDEATMFANYIHDNFPGKKVAVLAQSDDAGTEWVTPFEAESTKLGTKPAATVRFDLAAQSLETQVLSLQRSGAEVVAVMGRVDVVAKVLQEGAKIGYKPRLVVSNIGLSAQLFKLVSPDLAAGALFAGYFPPADAKTDAMAAHRDAMAKYAPNVKVDAFTMLGWSSADAIVEGMKKAGSSLDCKSFISGMESLHSYTNGLTPPISMSSTDHQAIDAQQILEARGTGFEAISDFLNPAGKPVGK